VRVPGQTVLAGSALCLDQAVRNLVDWELASADTAIALASSNPAAIIAPALATFGRQLPASRVTWSAALMPETVSVGDVTQYPIAEKR
jgi:N-acetylglucosamine-6-phosphate deacetylase